MQQSAAYWIGVLVGGTFVGVLCGLAPLIAGFSKNRQSTGVIGMVSCVVAGLVLGMILAVPTALIFTLVILLKPRDVPNG